MLAVHEHLQVLRPIVGLDAVRVVHLLVRQESTAELLLGDEEMLQHAAFGGTRMVGLPDEHVAPRVKNGRVRPRLLLACDADVAARS
jgi:hypothetical protein